MDLTFLTSPDYLAFYIVRSVFLSLSTLLAVGIVSLLVATGYLKTRWFKDLVELFSQRPYGEGGPARDWSKIEGYLDSDSEDQYKLAVMEAENLLNRILKRMDIEGEGIEQQLEQLPEGKVTNLEQLKDVHQLRNNIAYDPDYQLSKEEAELALEVYEQGLKELEAI